MQRHYNHNLSHLLLTMLLSDLPHEIIPVITDLLDDAGVNALARTHSQMYKLLNEHLYLRDMIKPYETRSLAWAVRSCVELSTVY